MPAIAATMRQSITSSGSIRQAKSASYTADQTRAAAARRHRAVIGHLKAEHHMGRNYLVHCAGDAVNAVLAAAGYNFHLLLRWLELLLSRFLAAQNAATALQWV